MRKWNAILSVGILILFLIHAVAGGFQLTGIMPGGSKVLSVLSWILVVLIIVHSIIGVKLTVETLTACKRAGASYFKENKLFWARRISGFAIFIFIFFHVILFMGNDRGTYRLKLFDGMQLATQLLLVVSIAVHVITNVNPLLVAFGIKGLKEYVADILILLSGLLLFMGIAFLVYYLRWNFF